MTASARGGGSARSIHSTTSAPSARGVSNGDSPRTAERKLRTSPTKGSSGATATREAPPPRPRSTRPNGSPTSSSSIDPSRPTKASVRTFAGWARDNETERLAPEESDPVTSDRPPLSLRESGLSGASPSMWTMDRSCGKSSQNAEVVPAGAAEKRREIRLCSGPMAPPLTSDTARRIAGWKRIRCPTMAMLRCRRATSRSTCASFTDETSGFSTRSARPRSKHLRAAAKCASAGVATMTASTDERTASSSVSATEVERLQNARTSGERSTTQESVAPSASRSTRAKFLPQAPQPTSATRVLTLRTRRSVGSARTDPRPPPPARAAGAHRGGPRWRRRARAPSRRGPGGRRLEARR